MVLGHTTWQPGTCSSNRRATSFPIPLFAPVTTNTFDIAVQYYCTKHVRLRENAKSTWRTTGCPGNFVGLNIGFTGSRGGYTGATPFTRGGVISPMAREIRGVRRNTLQHRRIPRRCLWLYRACRRVTHTPSVISMLEGVTKQSHEASPAQFNSMRGGQLGDLDSTAL